MAGTNLYFFSFTYIYYPRTLKILTSQMVTQYYGAVRILLLQYKLLHAPVTWHRILMGPVIFNLSILIWFVNDFCHTKKYLLVTIHILNSFWIETFMSMLSIFTILLLLYLIFHQLNLTSYLTHSVCCWGKKWSRQKQLLSQKGSFQDYSAKKSKSKSVKCNLIKEGLGANQFLNWKKVC